MSKVIDSDMCGLLKLTLSEIKVKEKENKKRVKEARLNKRREAKKYCLEKTPIR